MVRTSPRRLLAASLTVAIFALSACGGDGETTSTSDTGATGATGASGATPDITVGEFIAELQPQKAEILEELVAATPKCENVDVDSGFVLLVSANAIDADQDAPLDSIVTGEC